MATGLHDDAARGWTDDELFRLQKRMAREYAIAARDMRDKQRKALEAFAREREQREKALDDTPEAMREHESWLAGQAAANERLRTMADELAGRAVEANAEAIAAMNDELPQVFAENANRAAYAIDSALGIDTMFTLMSADTVRGLMRGEGPLAPEVPHPKHERAKDYRWNRQKFTSAITQGILQGESIPKIMKRTESVFGMNRRAAERAARTAVTGAENGGRVSAYKRAQRLGIGIRQEWLATLDGRTRDSHRQLDGEQTEVGEAFSNGCRYPGDPQGPPHEVWNCRCTLVAALEGIDRSGAARFSRLPEGVTYEEWKGGKRGAAEFFELPSVAHSMEIRGMTEEHARRLIAEEQGGMGLAGVLFGSLSRADQQDIFRRVLARFDGSAKAAKGVHAASAANVEARLKARGLGDVHAAGVSKVAMDAADEATRRVFFEAIGDLRLDDQAAAVDLYNPGTRGITIGMDRSMRGFAERADKAPFQTFFHEFGHFVDHRAGGFGDSASFAAGLGTTVKLEVQGLLRDIRKREGLNAYEAREYLTREVLGIPYANLGGISDIIHGATGGKCCDHSALPRHKKAYWKKGRPDEMLGKETFAHFFETTMANQQALETLKRYLPKTYNEWATVIGGM